MLRPYSNVTHINGRLDKNTYTMSQKKTCHLIFCFVSVKYESILIKNEGMSYSEHLTKLCIKCPFHLKLHYRYLGKI